jgi:hypothetical protein
MKFMNKTRSKIFQKTILLTLTLAAAGSAHAGFQYNPQDLVLGFRQSGGTSELTVNAGSVSNLLALSTGSSLTIANVTSAQLTTAFTDLNNLSWTACADRHTNNNVTYPLNTLWMIRQRDDLNTQTTPWNRQSQFGQGNTGGKIEAFAGGAVNHGTSVPTGPNNTSTGIIIPAGSANYAYSYFVGGGDFGTFVGNVEVTTAPDFITAGQPVRADFYELKPGSGSGTYLGFFQLNTNGVLTYTAGPSSVVIPSPTIVSIVRNQTTNTVTFTTVAGGTYNLRYTNVLSASVSAWPTVGSSVSGDGVNKSIVDVTTDEVRFYSISAH